jgi:hypothetical protein
MQVQSARPSEGLKLARFLMVLSSVSPLFVLWALRGSRVVDDRWLVTVCLLFILIPNGFLWWRISIARRHKELRKLTVARAEDHRDHLLVYLFAMLLPFYADEMATWRSMSCTLVAVGFIVFLFWHLNLHYMNVLFAVRGYRVFTVRAEVNGNPISGTTDFVLISRRVAVPDNTEVVAYRVSDTVYLEREHEVAL